MNWLKTLTLSLLISTPIIWIAWDVILGNNGAETESQYIAAAAHKSVAFPFIVGYWLGHLFANRYNVGASAWGRGLPIFLALALFDVLWNAYSGDPGVAWFRYPALWLAMGIPVGSLLWAQSL